MPRHNSIERSHDVSYSLNSASRAKLGPLQLECAQAVEYTGPGNPWANRFSGSAEADKYCVQVGKHPELCITMTVVEGYLEVHVMAARYIPPMPGHCGLPGPDTYVKTALREADRKFLKKKSRLVSGSSDPFYNHRAKFLCSDLPRR